MKCWESRPRRAGFLTIGRQSRTGSGVRAKPSLSKGLAQPSGDRNLERRIFWKRSGAQTHLQNRVKLPVGFFLPMCRSDLRHTEGILSLNKVVRKIGN